MAFPTVTGVHFLPSTGEFAYDTISAVGFQRGSSGLDNATIPETFFSSSPGQPTDYTNAIEQFQIDHPECKTVSLVSRLVLQFCRCVDLSCLSVDQLHSRGVRAVGGRGLRSGQLDGVWPNRARLPRPNPDSLCCPGRPASFTAVRQAIQASFAASAISRAADSRSFFYPFLLGHRCGFPWRGRITSPGDLNPDGDE